MKVKIITVTDEKKLLSDYINALGNFFTVEGIWEKEDGWDIYLPAGSSEGSMNELLKFLFDKTGRQFEFAISEYDDSGIDWNSEWKKNFKPVVISDRIRVYPAWFELPELKGDEIIIRIDPQMGFGTGTHETTQIMMQFLEHFAAGKSKMLDAGTGSGILSLLAEKLNPQCDIFAVDIDKDAIDNAKINAELNGSRRVRWFIGDISVVTSNSFDLIVANINRTVLETLIPEFVKRLEKNGILLLSGILVEEEDIISDLCKKERLELIEERHKNEWMGSVWIKK